MHELRGTILCWPILTEGVSQILEYLCQEMHKGKVGVCKNLNNDQSYKGFQNVDYTHTDNGQGWPLK